MPACKRNKSSLPFGKKAILVFKGGTYNLDLVYKDQDVVSYIITAFGIPGYILTYRRKDGVWAATINMTPSVGDPQFKFASVEDCIPEMWSWG